MNLLCKIGLHKMRIIDSEIIKGIGVIRVIWQCKRCGIYKDSIPYVY